MTSDMQNAGAMAAALAAGETSSVALVEAALEKITLSDGDVRAFITVMADSARAQAAASDARRAAGQTRGPLDGVVIALKDNIAVAGVLRTCGTAAFSEPEPANSTVAERLLAAGAVIIGTLNMHEGALGASTDNPFWGRCQNPLMAGYTPGGSSGGSAAAIAAGMVPLTLGTDTMGSVRIPAAYCGLWGLKPTKGRLPVTGLGHLSWTLDSIGPLAQTAGDLGLLLNALEGLDLSDPLGATMPQTPPIPTALSDLAFGVPDAAALADCEDVVIQSFDRFKASVLAAGVTLRAVTVEGWNPGALRRSGLLVSEVEGAVSLGDAVDGPGLSDEFRGMLNYGRTAGTPRLAKAYRQLQELSAAFGNAVHGLDGLLLPTAPQRAFAHGGDVPVNQADFTALANVAGAPAITMPLAAIDNGLPVGAQIIAPAGHDHRLVAIGELMETLSPISDWATHSKRLA